MAARIGDRRVARPLAVLGALLLAVAGCGEGRAPRPAEAPSSAASRAPSWPDVFGRTPDLLLVIRPRAIKRDGVYGAFWRSALRAAHARGFTRGETMVEAAEGAEEIVVGLDPGDAAIVLAGVPAHLDPEKMNDAGGHPLFRPLEERGAAAEYELVDRSAEKGSLFVLPDRTWVGALGGAQERARRVFKSPLRRPRPRIEAEGEGDALAIARVGGPLAHVLDRHPTFGPVARGLVHATLALRPDRAGLVATLTYEDEASASAASPIAARVLEELATDEKLAWLKEARVAVQGVTVLGRVALPPRLLEALPKASGADLGL